MDAVRDEIKKEIPKDFDAYLINPSGNFGGAKRGTNLELSIRGPDYVVLKEKVDELKKKFKDSKLMTDIDTDFRDGITEVHVAPDREKAAASGVSVQDIADTINTAIGGVRQGYFTNGIRRYDVRIRLQPDQWQTTSDIDKLLIRTGYGELIPLSSVTQITTEKNLLTITREMRERAINLYANTVTGVSLDKAMEYARKTAKDTLPDGYRLAEVGASKDVIEAFEDFIFTLVLGLVISYMVLAVQFNSFIHPIPVMIALPFSLTGAFLSLLLTHNSLNLYSFIGIIVLMGITLKNSILLVEFFNKQRYDYGHSLRDAILIGAPDSPSPHYHDLRRHRRRLDHPRPRHWPRRRRSASPCRSSSSAASASPPSSPSSSSPASTISWRPTRTRPATSARNSTPPTPRKKTKPNSPRISPVSVARRCSL